MLALSHLIAGLLTIHAAWAIAYLAGTLIDRRTAAPPSAASALTELVARSAAGVALIGLAAFALGIAGFLDVRGLLAAGAVLVLLLRAVHGPAFFRGAFWREQAARVGAAFTGPTLALYYLGLAASVPAIYPDITSDGVRYHLAYAVDWATHGAIYVDPFLRNPYYANNFLLIYAVFEVLGLDAYVHFTVWLTGLFAMLATRAALMLFAETLPPPGSALERIGRAAVTTLLPASIVICPAFLRWDTTGMLDAAIEAFVFIPALVAVAALTARRDLRWSGACCAGFAIGMKISLIVFAPLLAGLAWVTASALGGTRRASAAAAAAVIVLGSPWYVRNLVQAHDPIPPIITLAMHRRDPTYTRQDWRSIQQDLGGPSSAGMLAVMPWRAWTDPLDVRFREYGSVGLYVFLYVPFAFVAAAMVLGTRGRPGRALAAVSVSAAYAVAYCLATSYQLRYLTMVQPALAVSIGGALLMLPRRAYTAAVQLAAAVFSAVPSPATAAAFYRGDWASFYAGFERIYTGEDAYLATRIFGYEQARRVMESPPFAHRPAPRVLLVRVEVEYYFRRAGIQTIGDWVGPGRFSDLVAVLENDRFADYVRHFDIGAIIVSRRVKGPLNDAQFAALRSAAAADGFHTLEDDGEFYVAVR
ncbi:MAG TPA: hypothetical protein VK665_11545 [Candidatus Elarobacter sp.]|nr:hypothetical protein [Candidatus Elarobacter sp.]